MQLGMGEMIFIFLLALVIFGPKKLPEIGRQLGKALNEFKRASNEFRSQLEEEIRQIDVAEQAKKLAAAQAVEPVIAPPAEAIAQQPPGSDLEIAADHSSAAAAAASPARPNGHSPEIISPSAALPELNTQELNG